MLHNIAPHEFRNEYYPAPPQPEDYLFCFKDDFLLLKEGEIPRLCDIAALPEKIEFLFTVDKRACFLAYGLPQTTELTYHNAAAEFRNMEAWRPLAVATALQLKRWYQEHKFCGCCGQAMEKSCEERALVCACCGQVEYPKISPVVMVGLIDRVSDKILLTKYAGRAYANYALIAGFVEIGESLEQAVRREVKEEVGLDIGRLSYYTSQPWGISASLLAGFFVELAGSAEVTLDGRELAEARWFAREELPPALSPISLTQNMIAAFRNGGNLFHS